MTGSDQARAALAREIIDANLYMTLATSDREGRPWASPVYYAVAGYREFVWVSDPASTHSRNLAARPQVAIVIFDSRQVIDTGRGVYMSAVAERVGDAEIDRGLEVFSARSVSHGGEVWTRPRVEPPAAVRLYRATASDYSMIGPGIPRAPLNVAP
jgi:pyridoxine/pyridoxamine 5'-phosphate oxidase